MNTTNVSSETGLGFFKSLWGAIKRNAGAIIGGIIGGPIGAIIGMALDAWINGKLNTYVIEEMESIQNDYPISEKEIVRLDKWFSEKFLPTIKQLALKIDSEIIVQSKRMANRKVVNPNVIEKANNVLRAIAVLRANNKNLLENGERINKNTFFKYTYNSVMNKTAYSDYFLNVLEKATLIYVQENSKGYKLVSEIQMVSNTTKVELVEIDWQDKEVYYEVQKYVPVETSLSDNQNEVEVTNLDVHTNGSATNNETEILTTDKPKTKSNLLKVLGFISVAVVATTLIKKKSNK